VDLMRRALIIVVVVGAGCAHAGDGATAGDDTSGPIDARISMMRAPTPTTTAPATASTSVRTPTIASTPMPTPSPTAAISAQARTTASTST